MHVDQAAEEVKEVFHNKSSEHLHSKNSVRHKKNSVHNRNSVQTWQTTVTVERIITKIMVLNMVKSSSSQAYHSNINILNNHSAITSMIHMIMSINNTMSSQSLTME